VWVANRGAGTVVRVDPATEEVVATVRSGAASEGLTTDAAGRVWVAVAGTDKVVAIDPATATIVETVAAGDEPRRLVELDGTVWFTNTSGGTLGSTPAGS
jgi:DNA-binding beta-propeller fold protein YncE